MSKSCAFSPNALSEKGNEKVTFCHLKKKFTVVFFLEFYLKYINKTIIPNIKNL